MNTDPGLVTTPPSSGAKTHRIPRSRIIGIGVGLTLIFLCWMLPWQLLRPAITSQLERALGVPVEIGSISPTLLGLLPALKIADAKVGLSPGDQIRIESLRIRPALAPSWLWGNPAVRLELRSSLGRCEGVFLFGDPRGAKGSARDLDLTQLGDLWFMSAPLPLDGLADLNFHLLQHQGIPNGGVSLVVQKGKLLLPQFPIPIAFDSLAAVVYFTGQGRLQILSIELQGPLAAIRARGEVSRGSGGSRRAQQLDLEIGLQLRQRFLWPMARRAGIPLRADGSADFALKGPVTNPQVIEIDDLSFD